jgi:hypothetical protein
MEDLKVPQSNLDEKRAEAQAALAGAEWTAKHEKELKEKGLEGEEAEIQAKLATNNKSKETFELSWIELDNQRRAIRTVLNPLLDEEKKIETQEVDLEAEEAKIGLAADKHKVEEKRWAVQAKRQEIEKQKWAEEEKLAKIEATIQDNTTKYRALLDEEEKLHQRLEQLKLERVSLNK